MRCCAENRRSTNVPNSRALSDHGRRGCPRRAGGASSPAGRTPTGPRPLRPAPAHSVRHRRPLRPSPRLGAGGPDRAKRAWPVGGTPDAGSRGCPAQSDSGAPLAMPATRSAAAPALAAASPCGTVDGSSPRATCVDSGSGGTKTSAVIRSSTGALDPNTSPRSSRPEITKPPRSAGATLSGCPSSSTASSRRSPSSTYVLTGQRARQHEAADDGGGRGAEPAGVWDRVVAGQP